MNRYTFFTLSSLSLGCVLAGCGGADVNVADTASSAARVQPASIIGSQSTVPPPGYSLVWSDEFNGPVGSYPSAANWTYDLGAGGWGNNEQETYTNTNATVVADSSATDGLALDIASSKSGSTYYSSRIKTQGLHSFQYGYIECRAKVPPGGSNYQGYWPAFWTLGTDITKSGWPACGEDDVMEHLCGTQPNAIYQTLHGKVAHGNGSWSNGVTYTGRSDFGLAYHTYGVLWVQNSITFYVDGVQDGAPITPTTISKTNTWEFNKPEFLILNLAIGGNWPGNITSSTVFPAHFLIDYVRVYQ